MQDLRLRLDELRKWQRELENELTNRRAEVEKTEEELKRIEARLEVFQLIEGLSDDSGLAELTQLKEAASQQLKELKADPRTNDIRQLLEYISEHDQLLQSRYQVELLQEHIY